MDLDEFSLKNMSTVDVSLITSNYKLESDAERHFRRPQRPPPPPPPSQSPPSNPRSEQTTKSFECMMIILYCLPSSFSPFS